MTEPTTLSDNQMMQVQRAELALTLRKKGFTNPQLLSAIERTPKHFFVDHVHHDLLGSDGPIPIGCGQTLGEVSTIATMVSHAMPLEGCRVLELGTGSGYQTAILAEMGAVVFSVERYQRLLDLAATRLKTLAHSDVAFHHGDYESGWPEHAPYDRIIVNLAFDEIPEPLTKQLRQEGRMLVSIGPRDDVQTLHIVNHSLWGSRTQAGATTRLPGVTPGVSIHL